MDDKDKNPTLKASIITLYPEMFSSFFKFALAGKALRNKIWELDLIDLRRFGLGTHQAIDDTVYGGGRGMVVRADVAAGALQEAQKNNSHSKIIYPTPRGAPLTQKRLQSLAQEKHLILFCARFEGLDERVIEAYDIEEVSIGDYVLSGGEGAALILLDGIIRLLPYVIGNEESLKEESFSQGLLEYPLYTKPQIWRGHKVPKVLLSGNHKEIEVWRKAQGEEATRKRRPDLWDKYKNNQHKN